MAATGKSEVETGGNTRQDDTMKGRNKKPLSVKQRNTPPDLVLRELERLELRAFPQCLGEALGP